MTNINTKKKDLIDVIFAQLPNTFDAQILEELSIEELNNIILANRGYDYYGNIIRKQKIHVILYVFDSYTKTSLYGLHSSELDELYLKAIRKDSKQFLEELNANIEQYKMDALASGHDECLSYSEDELIIASGALVPADLLTEEEFISKSLLYRISQINKKIAELNKENEELENDIKTTRNYNEITEFRADIRYNNQCIIDLKNELKELTTSGDDSLSLGRK